jgi:hypothetical protein
MKICGLDVATKTGWCLAEGQTYSTGTFHPGKTENEGQRNAKFRAWLWTFLKHNKVEFVAIEAPIKGEMTVTETTSLRPAGIQKSISNYEAKATAAYLIGCAQEVCTALSIPFELVAIQTWRSTFLGKEKPQENESWKDVTVRVCKMMQIEVKSKDAAEAAGIAFWGQTHQKVKRIQGSAGPLFQEEDAA